MHYKKIFASEDAEWVLFIHGLGGSVDTWKYQMEDFKDYNIICVDLQGHGQTMFVDSDCKHPQTKAAMDIHAILEKEGIDKVHVVSLSLGTIVALEYANMYYDSITTMTLAGCVINLNFRAKVLLGLAQAIKYILPMRIVYPMFAKIIMPFKNHKISRDIFVRESHKMTRKSFCSWISTLFVSAKKLTEYIKNIKIHKLPVLFVTGNEDFLFMKGIVKLKNRIDDFKLYLINKCGHVCSIDKKKEFNEVVLKFIKHKAYV